MFQPVRYVRDHLPDDVDPVAAHVAIVIASFTDRNGLAEVGIRLLNQSTRLHPSTIVRAIRRLEELGVLAVDRRDRRRSRYRFPVTERLSTAVLPERTVVDDGAVLPERAARATRARTLDFSGENHRASAHTRANGEYFIPGSGWITPGAVNA